MHRMYYQHSMRIGTRRAGHSITGDNVLYHGKRRRCRICHSTAQSRAHKARKTRKLGLGEGLSQTAFETMSLNDLASKTNYLLEVIIPERRGFLEKSQLFTLRAERKADRLHKRMLQDQANYDKAMELYKQASETYDRRSKAELGDDAF